MQAANMLGDEKTVQRMCVAHRGGFREALVQAHAHACTAEEEEEERAEAPAAAMLGVLGRAPVFHPIAPHDATEVGPYRLLPCLTLCASRVFRRVTHSGAHPHRLKTCSDACDPCMQALAVLPHRVSVALLRAAFPGVAASPLHSPSYVIVPPELCTLPDDLCALALHACAPCIESESSLAIALDHPALSHSLDADCAALAMPALTALTTVAVAFSRSASDGADRDVYAALLENICALPRLATLEISDMPLAGPEEAALTGGLMHARQLREFKLRAVVIAPESIAALAQPLLRAPLLTLLDLRRCGTCDAGARALCRVLRQLTMLQDLRVGSPRMSDVAAAGIAEAAAGLPRLHTLWMSRVSVLRSLFARSAAVASVMAAAPALRALHICRFGGEMQAHALTAGLMAAAVGAPGRRLTLLDLERSVEQRDLAGGALAMLLGQLPALQSLSLAGCPLHWGSVRRGFVLKGVEAATHAIARLTRLRELNLAGNRILPYGVEMLAAALQELTSLETLDLTDTRGKIATRAAAALAEELAARMGRMRALQELRASGSCFCAAQGAALLCVGSLRLAALRVLRLADDALGAAGTFAFCRALPQLAWRATLQVLDVSGNGIYAVQLAKLLRATRDLPCLRELILSDNRFGYAGALQLFHAFREADGERAGGGGGAPRGLWRLRLLGVSGCALGADGLQLLLPELVAATQLQEVHVRAAVPAEVAEERALASLQSRRPMLYVK